MNNEKVLIIPRENYRLWFEFYRLCCSSVRTDLKLNLEKSEDFYRPWGDVTDVKFDDWWKSHSHLFQEPRVMVLSDLSSRQTSDSLVLEVPLNQSTSSLVEQIKEIVETNQVKITRKKKVKFSGFYQLTETSEMKLETIRNVLNIYRDVYLINKRPKIPQLLPLVEKYYQGKKRMKIHKSLNVVVTDLDNVLRNLGRWMKWGDKITENVSRGEFPGVYNVTKSV